MRKTKKNAKNFAPRHRARHWRATRKNSRYPYLASLKEEEAAALILANAPTSSTYEAEIWYGVSTAYGLALCKSWARLEPISKSYARNKFYIVFLKENHPKFRDFRPTFFRKKTSPLAFFRRDLLDLDENSSFLKKKCKNSQKPSRTDRSKSAIFKLKTSFVFTRFHSFSLVFTRLRLNLHI